MTALEGELAASCGREPSTLQRILIGSIVAKTVRLKLLIEEDGRDGVASGDQHHILAWMNSLSRDLERLDGMISRSMEPNTTQANIRNAGPPARISIRDLLGDEVSS